MRRPNQQFPHRPSEADQCPHRSGRVQLGDKSTWLVAGHGLVDGLDQELGRKRFMQECDAAQAVRALLHLTANAGDEDHRYAHTFGVKTVTELEAANAFQLNVEHKTGRAAQRQPIKKCLGGGKGLRRKATRREGARQASPHARVIFHHDHG